MSDIGFSTVKCPWCQERIRIDPFNLVTLTSSNEVREKLLEGEYDHFPCSSCNREIPYLNPIVCNDLQQQVLIYYFAHPIPDELQDVIQSSLIKAVEDSFDKGLPIPEEEGWRICIAFGKDELREMLSGHIEEEDCL